MTVCTIQEIKQLDLLRLKLGVPMVCLNPGDTGRVHYLIGYCQGLFNQERQEPEEHTKLVTRLLESIEAPMPQSHELFIGLKSDELSVTSYIQEASKPLQKDGRVPIIITTYDPRVDTAKIDEIFSAASPVGDNHTILVRIQLASRSSIQPAAVLIRSLYTKSVEEAVMPNYWPLIQADGFSAGEWEAFKEAVGEEVWPHVTIAATPFMSAQSLGAIGENVAVYQFFVGKADDISENGTVVVPSASCVGVVGEMKTYHIFDYVQLLQSVNARGVVGIVCGQSQGWSQEENVRRVERYLPLLDTAVKMLWNRELKEKVSSYYTPALVVP